MATKTENLNGTFYGAFITTNQAEPHDVHPCQFKSVELVAANQTAIKFAIKGFPRENKKSEIIQVTAQREYLKRLIRSSIWAYEEHCQELGLASELPYVPMGTNLASTSSPCLFNADTVLQIEYFVKQGSVVSWDPPTLSTVNKFVVECLEDRIILDSRIVVSIVSRKLPAADTEGGHFTVLVRNAHGFEGLVRNECPTFVLADEMAQS